MSNKYNTQLLERAAELIDELTSHPSGADRLLIQALDNNDLDEVHRLVVIYEGELSQTYFNQRGVTIW